MWIHKDGVRRLVQLCFDEGAERSHIEQIKLLRTLTGFGLRACVKLIEAERIARFPTDDPVGDVLTAMDNGEFI